jgi:3-hydroxymyristoyl/3-hydroxydecanoyl-(acyl carrier protein) dehydratase
MIPGDIMTIEAELTERVMKYFKFSCLVTSESKKIAKGKITLLINKK